jgi:putative ATP-binding cassette transporter
MSKDTAIQREQKKPLVRRFWMTARGFWSSKRSWKVAWLMTGVLVALVVGQLVFQYQLNVWLQSCTRACACSGAGAPG